MMRSLLLSSLCALLIALQPVVAVWPIPKKFKTGNTTLFLHQNLEIKYNDNLTQYTFGYEAATFDSHDIVRAGVSRALSTLFGEQFVPWMLHKPGDKFEPDVNGNLKWIKMLEITQTGKDDSEKILKPKAGEVDESYNLTLSADGEVKLTAVSSIGVLRGLETFIQLFYQHSAGTFWYTPYAPVEIEDEPKFDHRGLLIDTSRHFFPVDHILRTIDALAWNKMNRLHFHVTDSQSWPLEIPSMPELHKKGAHHPAFTYSPTDVDRIFKYGAMRGVQVYFEIDMPGHIGSVALSHPELITAWNARPYDAYCAQPPCGNFKLNSTKVDEFVKRLFDDLFPRISKYTSYFHTGGDEIKYKAYTLDDTVKSDKEDVLKPLLQKFFDKSHKQVRDAKLTPIVWEESVEKYNLALEKDVIVQTWTGDGKVQNVTSKGYGVIDSNVNYWYLDCGRGQWVLFDNNEYARGWPFNDWCGPTKSWQRIYSHDPRANLTAEQAKLVLGGEVAAWSETIDPLNFDPLVWPRASAAGEALWSGNKLESGQNRSQLEVAPRLFEWRERMVARGIRAAPLTQLFCTQRSPEECLWENPN